ncbi:hypothetical protein K435DRAFT_683233 [Dendrothele bispora CBS 962.96]|uniref:Uncharacterized protein n=1 Tax=Dendrothele bispora (strain CBS 962.96) TaxID=1314807 RepID=A0A4S8LD51_DENBC|nr:hypothetical protein K435DRAFT_683233 [Dendrothele bispora CBS 962.96]
MSIPSSSPNKNRPTSPIPIARHMRGRSGSVSSSDSSPPSELPTPNTASTSPRITVPSPGSSPILSYFFAQSPSKNTATFPFRKFGTAPVFEEDESSPNEPHAAHHARRASTTVADRFNQPTNNTMPDNHLERGSGLMRRLSLSTAGVPAFGKQPQLPEAPPNSAVSPTGKGFSARRATLAVDAKPRRAPSPMGERILKGHFDGFN